MKSGEAKSCADNGVTKITEVKIGYDGIVFASRRDSGAFELTQRQIYLAVAAQIPNGTNKFPILIDNPYTNWKQIDASLPDQEIMLAIPASNHGTREVFEESGLIHGCKEVPGYGRLSKDQAGTACKAVRKDGRVVEIAGDYTETLARLNADKNVVGVFGLSFYEANRDRLQVASVAGVVPTLQTVESGQYPISRPLFFYIKDAHIGVIPGLQEYAKFFVSAGVSGMGSPLEQAGLVPLNDNERAEVLSNIESRKGL